MPSNVSGGVVPSLATVRVTCTLGTVCCESETFHCRKATLLDVHVSISRSEGHNTALLVERTSTPVLSGTDIASC